MENIIIIVAFVFFLYFLLMGQYISSTMFATGILGIFLIGGTDLLSGFLQNDSFQVAASYSLTTIPLYVLMAQFIMQAGIVGDLYGLMYRVSRGRAAPLGIMTVILGGLLGGVSGSSSATTATLGQIATPELQKRGYPSHFAGAVAAASGSLSSIIPPSIILIIYGTMTRIPVGELFIAALIPGILLMVSYILVVIFYLGMNREQTETNSGINMSDDVPMSRYVISIVMCTLMAIAIFWGIFSGIFTPSEAGAIGAFIALIMAFLLKKVNLDFMKNSLIETTKITVMAMFIVIGASLFSRFVSLSLFPRKIINLLGPLMESPTLVMVVLMTLYFFLFMFVDSLAVIVMTMPIIIPMLEELQADPLWFGIMLTVTCTIGTITPPVGNSVFVVGAVTGISIGKIFKTSMIFAVFATFIVIGLLIAFPELATWLPSQMK